MDLRDQIIEHINSENLAPETYGLMKDAAASIEAAAIKEGELLAKVRILKLELKEQEQRNQDLLELRNTLQMKLEAIRAQL